MTTLRNNPANFNSVLDHFFAPVFSQSEFVKNTVLVNVHENNNSYTIEVNAPGRKKEDFKIEISKCILTISAETESINETKDYTTKRREFKINNFKRTFTVDDIFDIDAIQAKYENGILSILLPKKAEQQLVTKQISIN